MRTPEIQMSLALPDPATVLPSVTVLAQSDSELVTRQQVLAKKKALKRLRSDASSRLKDKSLLSAERDDLYKEAQHYYGQESELEDLLSSRYLPLHSPNQLLNPRLFMVTPLFRVASRSAPREEITKIVLGDDNGTPVSYVGPELRQAEGLVFMALINVARDVQAGVTVQFTPSEFCNAIFGRYDGPTRNRLKEYIRRLQAGQIRTKNYTVQLCQRFEHPATGPWSVALDKDIVHLFSSSNVWLSLKDRVELSDGLSSWLYGYVEAQTTLIPTSVEALRNFCGSGSTGKSFLLSLRAALKELVEHKVIDAGFYIKGEKLYWRKCPPTVLAASV